MSTGTDFEGRERADVCPGCGNAFTCGMLAGQSECWCARLPKLPLAPDPALGCYCPQCLARMPQAAEEEGRR